MKKLLAILLANFIFLQLPAQTFNSTKLDSLLSILESYNKFMGGVAVSLGGELIYQKSVGFADLKKSIPNEAITKYRVGSISKMFTASLIFLAVEEGKLKLDQKLNEFYPEIENADKITIANLLNHRTGIISFTDDPTYLDWCTKPQSEAQLLGRMKGSIFEPDTKSQYSNSNYVLLTYILQKTYKMPLSQLLDQKIIKPLNLQNTYLGAGFDTENKESYSYKFDKKWKQDMITDLSIPLGAGAVVSTPADLTQFITALFDYQIIKKESLDKMITIVDGYGSGIFQFPYGTKKVYGHTGGIDGFSSFLVYFPEDKLAAAICANGSNYDNNSILLGALASYFNNPYELPVFGNYNPSKKELEQLTGMYSSNALPLKIEVRLEGSRLMAQATDQGAFPLEPSDENTFRFDAAGIVMVFSPEENSFILKQGGGNYTFKKEE